MAVNDFCMFTENGSVYRIENSVALKMFLPNSSETEDVLFFNEAKSNLHVNINLKKKIFLLNRHDF